MLIEEAIGRWFIYQGDSPDDLVQLVERGYLAAMPVNPYSGVAMRSVPLDSQNVPGEYTYLKGYPITPEGGLGLSSYALLVYGHGSYRCEFMDYLGLGSNVLHASGQHVLFQDWDKDGDWMDGITGPEVPEEGLIRLYRSECSTDWVKRAQDLPAPAPRAPQG